MLNQDRIRLMTKLAAYEQGEGRKYMPVTRYYKGDYIAWHLIKTFLCANISFAILFILGILYEIDAWLAGLYTVNYMEYAAEILIKYIAFVAVYLLIGFFLFGRRYREAKKMQKRYLSRLKKVQKLHEREEKLLPLKEIDF